MHAKILNASMVAPVTSRKYLVQNNHDKDLHLDESADTNESLEAQKELAIPGMS